MQKDWKFSDFSMLLNERVEIHDEYQTFKVLFVLNGLDAGSLCFLCGNQQDQPWLRKTRSWGFNGSVCYETYPNLDAALKASIEWARHRDDEWARGLAIAIDRDNALK